ncbi:DUF2829 domain-containing protein [Ligilactobacillus apodemi]|uniref:Thoeris anti-defense 2-like domain-containing protein n=1 Tax=Ligilactobacillus apodemi DSM 16634 = JCM 16172 TaxID=1423724 RepID=A0A0R1U5Z8_9LACO|nr:DUF2829 domain-containing protein [Ligilactobacillus apodemi]KRL86739.1 hypothetical protein FC32_GL001780 [Ligilactobacillus apodemi DSM 16634 = JCM 16172]MBD5068742.1 DUF2829 domain-containing protein [Lactobacillus sp.]MBD5069171.1 DUF2829 domain-containing protein [Lactobacillus sp.]
MTFEQILPALKAGKKAVRTVGWGGSEEYIFVVNDDTLHGEKINPYLMIKTKEEPALSQFMPTSCDVLADDWELVD